MEIQKEQQPDLYNINQIRQLERLAIDELKIPEFELMQRAGKAAFEYLNEKWPNRGVIHVICGHGNNGGDGYILAYHAKRSGLRVIVHSVGGEERFTDITKKARQLCEEAGVEVTPFENTIRFDDVDILVDALLGIGIANEVTPLYHDVIAIINATMLPVLAIDVPSGLDADTGTVLGTAIQATSTITFIGLKQGLFTNDGPDCSGSIHLASLDLPRQIYANIQPNAHLLSVDLLKTLGNRKKNTNKASFGHVLILGGSKGMFGAVRLAAEAALRVGAGLVSVVTQQGGAAIICAHQPEIMCHELPDKETLFRLIQRATVVVVGPGLGKDAWAMDLLNLVLATDLPLVIDADALNLLGVRPTCQSNWVLTPHPGEAARLLDWQVHEVQTNRFRAITELTEKGGNWVLKGVGTLIKKNEPNTSVCQFGNPGMASAGMGDVLSGIIGGLIAQKLSVNIAANTGVLIHALAGDLVAKKGQRGMLASDLIIAIPDVINQFRS